MDRRKPIVNRRLGNKPRGSSARIRLALLFRTTVMIAGLVLGWGEIAPGVLGASEPALPQRAGRIDVGPNLAVSGRGAEPYTEPVVAVHPSDPEGIAIVAIAGFTRRPGAPGWRCASWHTRDGGRSWSRFDIDIPRCADPGVTIDRQGRVYAAVLRDGVTVLRAPLGRDWQQRVRVPGSDHPVIAVRGDSLLLVTTLTRGRGPDRSSGLYALRSDDGGASFDGVGTMIREGFVSNAIAPAVLGGGRVVLGGSEFARVVGRQNEFLESPRLWAIALEPNREGLPAPVSVTRDCENRVGFPVLAGGPSRAYAVCVGAGGSDILVFASDDGGRSWSDAHGVFGGGRPRLERGARIERRSPVLRRAVGAAVNADGVLGVVWQDRSADSSRRCQRLRFTASTDGGRTFASPVSVSDAPSCPDNPGNREAGFQWPAGTDYGAIAAAPDGSFVTTWADARDGAFRIFMARTRVD